MRTESSSPPKRTGSVKLVDVAAQAGVSLATASRALSNPELVRATTLEKVRQAADDLGYVPHGAARALASQRTRTIGAVFPPVDNPIFATGTRSLARELTRAGYTLLLATHDYDETEEIDAVRRLIERGVDGLVLVGTRHSSAVYNLLNQAGLPFELTWSLDESGRHHSVGVDHRRASANIAEYLLRLGHREFAVIAGILANNDRADERLRGVNDALAAAAIDLQSERVVQAEFSVKSGRRALSELLERAPGFTALICANDVLAVGALHECNARSIDVPGQLSVVGYDDIDVAAALTPGLTTVRMPSAEIGRVAAVRLLARLNGRRVERCELLPTRLIERESAGRPATLPEKPVSR